MNIVRWIFFSLPRLFFSTNNGNWYLAWITKIGCLRGDQIRRNKCFSHLPSSFSPLFLSYFLPHTSLGNLQKIHFGQINERTCEQVLWFRYYDNDYRVPCCLSPIYRVAAYSDGTSLQQLLGSRLTCKFLVLNKNSILFYFFNTWN